MNKIIEDIIIHYLFLGWRCCSPIFLFDLFSQSAFIFGFIDRSCGIWGSLLDDMFFTIISLVVYVTITILDYDSSILFMFLLIFWLFPLIIILRKPFILLLFFFLIFLPRLILLIIYIHLLPLLKQLFFFLIYFFIIILFISWLFICFYRFSAFTWIINLFLRNFRVCLSLVRAQNLYLPKD